MRPTPSLNSRNTQRSRILAPLIRAHGEWVPSPELAAIALQYNARLFELKKLGFRIENRREKRDGKFLSWFRLVPNRSISTPNQPRVALEPSRASTEGESTGEPRVAPLPRFEDSNSVSNTLFGDLAPTHKDLG